MDKLFTIMSILLLTCAMNGAAQVEPWSKKPDNYFMKGNNGYFVLLAEDGTPTSEVRLVGKYGDMLDLSRYYGNENVPDEVEHEGKTYHVVEFGEFRSSEHLCTQLKFGKNMRHINFFKPEFPLDNGIEVSDGNMYYKTIDNILYTADGKTLLMCTSRYTPQSETFIIPDTVEIIGKDAFAHCKNIKNIQLPKSLKQISQSAFEECKNMPTDFELPEGLLKIEKWAFNATTIYNLILPSTLESIEDLGSIYNLASIECRATLPPSTTTVSESGSEKSWNNYYHHYQDAKLIVPNGCKELYRQHQDWGKFKQILEFGEVSTNVQQITNKTIYAEKPISNLAGQKVNASYKGVAIQNGKKIVVR